MKTVPRWTDRDRNKDYSPRIKAHAPALTMEEVATLLNLTEEQVYHAHANAIKKLRAALTSFGYHKETNR